MNHLLGKFIVFDGIEGCGKSTQAALLAERLTSQGLRVVHVHDPGTTRIGTLIRSLLLSPENIDMSMRCEMLLYMAARAQMMSELVLPALSDGKVVISDRFVSSTLAYQVGGDELTPKEIRDVAEIAIKRRWPDLTLVLDIPLEHSAVRIDPQDVLPFPAAFKPRRDKDRIEQRPLEYHMRVRERFLTQAKRDPGQFRVIKADQTIERVHQEVIRELESLS